MIDITDSVCSILETIPELEGRVYRAWPQSKLTGIYATVFRISRAVENVAHDGSELVVRVTYSVNLTAPDQVTIDTLEADITDLLASYNLHSTAAGPTLMESTNVFRQSIIVSGAVDCRGNIFT